MKNLSRISLSIISLCLLLFLSQCKEEEASIAQKNQSPGIELAEKMMQENVSIDEAKNLETKYKNLSSEELEKYYQHLTLLTYNKHKKELNIDEATFKTKAEQDRRGRELVNNISKNKFNVPFNRLSDKQIAEISIGIKQKSANSKVTGCTVYNFNRLTNNLTYLPFGNMPFGLDNAQNDCDFQYYFSGTLHTIGAAGLPSSTTQFLLASFIPTGGITMRHSGGNTYVLLGATRVWIFGGPFLTFMNLRML